MSQGHYTVLVIKLLQLLVITNYLQLNLSRTFSDQLVRLFFFFLQKQYSDSLVSKNLRQLVNSQIRRISNRPVTVKARNLSRAPANRHRSMMNCRRCENAQRAASQNIVAETRRYFSLFLFIIRNNLDVKSRKYLGKHIFLISNALGLDFIYKQRATKVKPGEGAR